jgi:hypothetical protein
VSVLPSSDDDDAGRRGNDPGQPGRDAQMALPGQPPPLPGEISVPDDLSDLNDEVVAVRRELRTNRTHQLMARMPLTGRWVAWPPQPRRGNLPGAAVSMLMMLLVALGTALIIFPPGRGAQTSPRVPLASPTVPVGTRGGLVPNVLLRAVDGSERSARTFRPAVLIFIPVNCNCGPAVRKIVNQALEVGVTPSVVSTVPGSAEAAKAAAATRVNAFTDKSGQFAKLAGPGTDPTPLLVAGDGTLAANPAPFTGTSLESKLAELRI